MEGKEAMYVFNGFYFSMRAGYVPPKVTGEAIYTFCVEWDASTLKWSDFRDQVLGQTDPAESPQDSLRGHIFQNWKALDLSAQPNVGDNAVHASASPFEGLAERNNWMECAFKNDVYGQALLEAGLSSSLLKAWSVDPQVTIDDKGKKGSLFDAVECLDSEECTAKLVELGELNRPWPPAESFTFDALKEGDLKTVGVAAAAIAAVG